MACDVRDLGSAFARRLIVRSCTCNVSVEMAGSARPMSANANAATLWGIAGGTSPGDMRSILPEAFAYGIWPAKVCHMTTISGKVTRCLDDLSASPHAPVWPSLRRSGAAG